MRVMKAFQIEANYQKHKKRLTSIQGFDTKRKVSSTASKTMERINNFKKHRLTAQIFNENEKMNQLSKNNAHMQKTLTKVYCRDPHKKVHNLTHDQSLKRMGSKSSIKSANSQSSRIRDENLKIGRKLADAKSTYSKFRQTGYSQSHKATHKNQNQKEELVRLLQMQLGTKPQVLFPNVKKKRADNMGSKKNNMTSKVITNSSKLNKSGSVSSYGNLSKGEKNRR